MKQNVLLCTLALLTFAIGSQAQDWNLAGNNNAAFTSKLGTTTAVPLNLTTSNLTRIRIAVDGKVGVGTINPQQRFHVEGTSNQAIFVNTSALGPTSGSGMIGYVKGLPTAAGNRLGYFLLGSRGGAENNYNVAGMVGYAGDAWTASSRPAYLAFETVASGSTTRTERLRITPHGYVGIGTASPVTRLHVVGNIDDYNSVIYGEGVYTGISGYASDEFGTGIYGSSNWIGVYGYSEGSGYGGAFSSAFGTGLEASTTYGTYAATFYGNVFLNNGYTTSDKNLKQNIKEFTGAMSIINKLKPQNYEFKTEAKYASLHLPKGSHYGLMAQDLEEVLPGLVSEAPHELGSHKSGAVKPDANGKFNQAIAQAKEAKETIKIKAVNYTELIPIIVKGMQEQDAENKELKSQVNELQERLSKLEALLSNKGNGAVTYNSAYLEQNAPNPVRGTAVIRYQVPLTVAAASIAITNAKGQVVRTMSINNKGTGQVNFNTSNLAAGTYNYTLIVDGRQADTKRLIVAK